MIAFYVFVALCVYLAIGGVALRVFDRAVGDVPGEMVAPVVALWPLLVAAGVMGGILWFVAPAAFKDRESLRCGMTPPPPPRPGDT